MNQAESKIISFSNLAQKQAKGIIANDTQYRLLKIETVKLLEKADMLAIKGKHDKVKKLQKTIIANSAELLEYERFRMEYV